MRKRWVAVVVAGAALAGPAAAQTTGAGRPPQQTAQSQAEHERGLYRAPPNHQDPAADKARQMENAEGHSRTPQPAPARR